MTDPTAEIPPELFARLARPTVRLSGSIDEAAAGSFLSQVLPTLEVPGSIVVELFSSGGEAEVGRRLAQEVRLLRQAHGRDMWFLGKAIAPVGSLIASNLRLHRLKYRGATTEAENSRPAASVDARWLPRVRNGALIHRPILAA
jgi:hypothetical protein